MTKKITSSIQDHKRQVVPRLLPVSTNSLQTSLPRQRLLEFFNSRVRVFDLHPNSEMALEVLNASLLCEVQDHASVNRAIQILKESDHSERWDLLFIAAKHSGQIDYPSLMGTDPRKEISVLRRRLKLYPKDPLRWIQLGYWQTVVGNNSGAEKSYTVAMQLGADHPFVARSASRFFLHSGDDDRAAKAIRTPTNWRSDPWLLAADIAIRDVVGKPTEGIKRGLEYLEAGTFAPQYSSELAAAIATIHWRDGEARKARQMLRAAAQDPTENANAQVEYLNPRLESAVVTPSKQPQFNFEASSRRFFREKEFESSLAAADRWLNFQPFSCSALVWTSYLHSTVLNQHAKAIDLIYKHIRAVGREPILLNNLAFYHSQIGEYDRAAPLLAELESHLGEEPVVLATKGNYLIRTGHVEAGKSLYAEAIAQFKSKGVRREELMARFHRLEALAAVEDAELLDSMDEIAKASDDLKLHELSFRIEQGLLRIGTKKVTDPKKP